MKKPKNIRNINPDELELSWKDLGLSGDLGKHVDDILPRPGAGTLDNFDKDKAPDGEKK